MKRQINLGQIAQPEQCGDSTCCQLPHNNRLLCPNCEMSQRADFFLNGSYIDPADFWQFRELAGDSVPIGKLSFKCVGCKTRFKGEVLTMSLVHSKMIFNSFDEVE